MRSMQRQGPLTGTDRARGKPVLLATMEVPFELGQRLIIANFVERAPLPLSTMLGYDELPYLPELEESLREPAQLAASLGVEVTTLRVKSFHPVQAMLEVLAEQGAGIFVFGPDRRKIRRLRYRRAARAIRENATSLVWLAEYRG